jgi:hypothetical protein
MNPSFLSLEALHNRTAHFLPLFEGYNTLTLLSGRKSSSWQLSDVALDVHRQGVGGHDDAARHYLSDEQLLYVHYSDTYTLGIVRLHDKNWEIRGSTSSQLPVTVGELQRQLHTLRGALRLPGLIRAVVSREYEHHTQFPLRPPIAAANYAVITTEADVDAAYLEPEVFWNAWDTIEEHGDFRLCTRGLHLPDPIDERAWLAHTFDDSMAMARAARPKQTWYGLASRPGPRYAPFWEPGDPADGKAGFACIAPIGYDPATRTVEYTAYVPPPTGGIPNHLLLYDIHIIRAAVIRKKTLKGEPVDTVRVVFLDEAAARAERRPLLDVGARVFFHTADKRLVELTD